MLHNMKLMIQAPILLFLIAINFSCATNKDNSGLKPTDVSASFDSNSRIVVLFFTDLHGRLRASADAGGYAEIAALVEEERAKLGERSDLLVLNGGDAAGKSSVPCVLSKEKDCFSLLPDLGVQLSVLGNSELTRSVQELNELIALSGHTWISANIHTKSEQSWKPYFVFNGIKSGIRLGLTGWTAIPTPGEIDLKRAGYEPNTAITSKNLEKWMKPLAGMPVLWLTHVEVEDDKKLLEKHCHDPGQNNKRGANNNQRVLAVIKGHGHTTFENQDACVPMFQAGGHGVNVLKLILEPRGAEISLVHHEFLELKSRSAVKPSLKKKIDQLYVEKAPNANRVMAQVSRDLTAQEFAKWAATAFRATTRADIAIVNIGAVKSGVMAGALSLEEMNFVYPYKDEIMGLDINTKKLESALCKSSMREMDGFLDYGSQLILAGADLLGAGTEDCRLEVEGGSKRSVKIALVKYVVGRSERWLGQSLQSKAFRYGIDSERAFELYLKRTGEKL
jgi:2',3'-cyclic-nucleotide 2'-phosphodiesterase (5'-nucleotidase family)